MLETVSKGFKAARDRLKGYRELTADNIDEAVQARRLLRKTIRSGSPGWTAAKTAATAAIFIFVFICSRCCMLFV